MRLDVHSVPQVVVHGVNDDHQRIAKLCLPKLLARIARPKLNVLLPSPDAAQARHFGVHASHLSRQLAHARDKLVQDSERAHLGGGRRRSNNLSHSRGLPELFELPKPKLVYDLPPRDADPPRVDETPVCLNDLPELAGARGQAARQDIGIPRQDMSRRKARTGIEADRIERSTHLSLELRVAPAGSRRAIGNQHCYRHRR